VFVLAACLWWWWKTHTLIEGNNTENAERARDDTVAFGMGVTRQAVSDSLVVGRQVYKDTKTAGDGLISAADKVNSGLGSIIDAIRVNKEVPEIKWRDIYFDGEMKPAARAGKLKEHTYDIIGDDCNRNAFLKSDYAEDICTKYIGDYETINEKCQGVPVASCGYLSCCALLNGNKCVAGTANGPVYSTYNGKTVDYDYYIYKNQCYGNCDLRNSNSTACGRYANNSTNVSKDCILKLFNDAGCPNLKPSFLTDKVVRDYSQSSKLYIQTEMKNYVESIKDAPDSKSENICYGS
jgi:hypothetical protein